MGTMAVITVLTNIHAARWYRSQEDRYETSETNHAVRGPDNRDSYGNRCLWHKI